MVPNTRNYIELQQFQRHQKYNLEYLRANLRASDLLEHTCTFLFGFRKGYGNSYRCGDRRTDGFFTTKISCMHTDNQILLLMSAIKDNNSRSRVYS